LVAAGLQHRDLQRLVGGPELQPLRKAAATHQRQTELVSKSGVCVAQQIVRAIIDARGDLSGGAAGSDHFRLGLGLLNPPHCDVLDQPPRLDIADSRPRAAARRGRTIADPRFVQHQAFLGGDARKASAEHAHRPVVPDTVRDGGTVQQDVHRRLVVTGNEIQGHLPRQPSAAADARPQDEFVHGRRLVDVLLDAHLHQDFRDF
jgi:hypothetical protein